MSPPTDVRTRGIPSAHAAGVLAMLPAGLAEHMRSHYAERKAREILAGIGHMTPSERDMVLLDVARHLRLPVMVAMPSVSVRIRHAQSRKWENKGVVSRHLVTNAGVAFLAACFTNASEPETINYHAIGTGTTAEAVTQTALVAEVETRVAGTQSNPSANVYRTVGLLTAAADRVIEEHGVFTAIVAGTLWDRSLLGTQTLRAGSQLEVTYNVTWAAGG